MNKGELSADELQRYSRHLILPEFNIEGQRKLKNSKVLVVGAGGLGSPILLYLTAAGVGTIGIIDYDVVDKTNLQRQVLFTTADLGLPKAAIAAGRLAALNPNIEFKVFEQKLTSANALDILSEFDLVADGTDNFPTRYLVNDACVLLNKPTVHGAIYRFEGQVSVFNYKFLDGSRGPDYRDLFPNPPPPGLIPSCAEGGVLGVLPGIIGSLQANEIIKVLTGIGEPLAGKLYIFDALSFESRTLKVNRNPKRQNINALIDYEEFCGTGLLEPSTITEISVEELKSMMDTNDPSYVIIDVREPYEFQICNLGGHLIPLGSIDEQIGELPTATKTVIICRSGVRSRKAIEKLQGKGIPNLYNLRGGLLEWADKVDHSFPKY